MQYYTYQFDDELRVVEDRTGYQEIGVTRKVKVPSLALQNHVDAVMEFRDNMELLLLDFTEEVDTQENEITGQMRVFLHQKSKAFEG